MDWKTLLFSPVGRLNRARYWIALIICELVFLVPYVPFAAIVDDEEQRLSAPQIFGVSAIVIIGLLLSYIGIILAIKRFHDRNKSGWWVLISLVPIIGGFWFLIECGFLRGTIGRNRFGPDPLAPNDDIVNVFGGPEQPPALP